MVKFVLLTTQRTGSTWVIDILNSHPEVSAYSELFLENGKGTPTWGGAKDVVFWETYLDRMVSDGMAGERRHLLFAYLDDLFGLHPELSAVGFKLMYGQAGAHPDLISYLTLNDIRIIHLIRRNLLDIVVSREVAVARDIFHARRGSLLPVARVRLDPSLLLKRLQELDREVREARDRFGALGLPYVEVCYENLAARPLELSKLLEHLNVKDVGFKLESSLQKVITRTHAEVISNYAAVRDLLSGTPFRDMLT